MFSLESVANSHIFYVFSCLHLNPLQILSFLCFPMFSPESVANSNFFMFSHVFTWIRCKFSYFLCFHLNPLQILIFFMFSYVFTWIRCQFFDVFCIFSNFLSLFKVMVTISSALTKLMSHDIDEDGGFLWHFQIDAPCSSFIQCIAMAHLMCHDMHHRGRRGRHL